MKLNIKEFFPPKRLCEAYPYGARWYQRWNWKLREWSKIGLNIIAWFGITGSVGYGIFILGWYSRPEVIKAFDREPAAESIPVLERIAKCESGGKQFKDNGKVMRGRTTPEDIGKYQIRETVWNDKARELGYDIYSEQGNHDMAVWVYHNHGTEPWYSSVKCWR